MFSKVALAFKVKRLKVIRCISCRGFFTGRNEANLVMMQRWRYVSSYFRHELSFYLLASAWRVVPHVVKICEGCDGLEEAMEATRTFKQVWTCLATFEIPLITLTPKSNPQPIESADRVAYRSSRNDTEDLRTKCQNAFCCVTQHHPNCRRRRRYKK